MAQSNDQLSQIETLGLIPRRKISGGEMAPTPELSLGTPWEELIVTLMGLQSLIT